MILALAAGQCLCYGLFKSGQGENNMGLQDRDYMHDRAREREGGRRSSSFGTRSSQPPMGPTSVFGRRKVFTRRRRGWSKWMTFAVIVAIAAALLVAARYVGELRYRQPFPPTGETRWYTTSAAPSLASLSITAPKRIPSTDYLVLFNTWEGNAPVAAIPVRNAETAVLNFPLGRYRMVIVKGWLWQGHDRQFGMGTNQREAVHPLEFSRSGNSWNGHTIELDKDMFGNLETRPIWR